MMHGRIWLESEPIRGSRFHFTAQFGIQKNFAPRQNARRSLVNIPVLVVDDNSSSRRATEQMLREFQMNPTAASNGREGLAALREVYAGDGQFALVIADAQMPDMDGFAFIEEMRKDRSVKCAIIMLLTSGGFRGDAARCRELGVSAYVTKPIGRTELYAAICAVVDQHLAGPEAAPPNLVTRHSLREAGAIKGLRVLLVEDDRVNQHLAVRLLEKLGHQVELAVDGGEALAALEKKAFDVVLMDIQMPGMDGFEVTSAVREKERSTGAHQMIIATTAHALTGDRERCLAAGMDGYVSKPIHYQDLIRAIDELLASTEVTEKAEGDSTKSLLSIGQALTPKTPLHRSS
jgi:two-component system sensor histidine kinase/response regulator